MIRYTLLALCLISFHVQSATKTTAYGERHAIEKEELVFQRYATQESFECAAIEVRPGKMLVAWLGGTEPDASDIRVFFTSNDKDLWLHPRELASGNGLRCWYPALAKLRNGEILCFYRVGREFHAATAYLKRSTDGGETWSEPQPLGKKANGPEHPLVLTTKEGNLVYGVTGGWGLVPAAWTEESTDRAKTWDLQTSIPPRQPGMYLVAPSLFYGPDHSLRAVCSNSNLTLFCLSESVDGGDSWSPAFPISLPNLGKGIGMVTLKDGRIIAVYNDARTAKQKRSEKHQVSLAVSHDDGRKWNKSMLLETRHGEFGSPVALQTQDGVLHIFYNWKRKNIKHVIINPKMIMAGEREVTP